MEQKANEENLANAMSTLEKIVINQVQIENKIDHYTVIFFVFLSFLDNGVFQRRVNAAENELKEATDLEKEKQQETQVAVIAIAFFVLLFYNFASHRWRLRSSKNTNIRNDRFIKRRRNTWSSRQEMRGIFDECNWSKSVEERG